MDKEALKFFGVKLVKKHKKPARTEKAKREAVDFIENQRGGENLIALIEAEGDIFFIKPNKSHTIQLDYYGSYYSFDKTSNIVSEIAKTIVRIKPNSEYIKKVEPMTNTSYRMLIR